MIGFRKKISTFLWRIKYQSVLSCYEKSDHRFSYLVGSFSTSNVILLSILMHLIAENPVLHSKLCKLLKLLYTFQITVPFHGH